MSFHLNKYYSVGILLILSLLTLRAFFISGFFPMHDDTQVARVYEMGKSLRLGMFPVRFVPDLGYGYGYPLFNFYGPVAYYIGGIFVLMGFDALLATKLMMAIGIILAGAAMWLLAREFFGEWGGVVAGAFYLYAPYHALDIYVRGDVAEYYAYAFLPLIFYGLQKMYKTGKWKYSIVTAVSFALLISAHNLTAMMVTPFIIIVALVYCVAAYRNKQLSTIRYTLFSILFGITLAAFYWLPALWEMGKTNVLGQIGGGADYKDHFVCLSQLWDSPWGYGGSTKGCIDGLSFRIGKVHILGVVLSALLIVFFAMRKKEKQQQKRVITLSLLGFVVSCFLLLGIAQPLWDIVKPMAFFQYPWRFLLLVSFFASFLAGSVIWEVGETMRVKKQIFVPIVSLIMLFSMLFFYLKLFLPQTILPKTALDYTSNYAIKWVASKISDEYLPKDFKKPKDYAHVFQGEPTSSYTQTPIEKLANIVSVASAGVLVLGIIMERKKARR